MIREKEEKEDSPRGIMPASENKGRQVEEDYFFPDKRVTIRASSLSEAIKKLNDIK
jgi:hypothetical protein